MHVGKAAAIKKAHLAAGVVLLASLLASAPAAAQSRGARPTATLDRPDIIFQNYCSVCHGEKGDGQSLARHALDPQPVDFTAEETRKRLSRAHMIEVLSKGSRTKEGKTTAMVSWKAQLSRPQIEAVVDYVIVNFMAGKVASSDQVHAQGHEHEGHDHSKANVKEMDYPYGLKANAARGKTIYAANCAKCHGAKGDGRGNSPLIGSSKPRNFHDADFREFGSGFSVYSAVSRGKGHMPAWDKTLSTQDIADVSEYVLRTFAKPRRTARAN
jgi:mono/diheme cytochrome c family protein